MRFRIFVPTWYSNDSVLRGKIWSNLHPEIKKNIKVTGLLLAGVSLLTVFSISPFVGETAKQEPPFCLAKFKPRARWGQLWWRPKTSMDFFSGWEQRKGAFFCFFSPPPPKKGQLIRTIVAWSLEKVVSTRWKWKQQKVILVGTTCYLPVCRGEQSESFEDSRTM